MLPVEKVFDRPLRHPFSGEKTVQVPNFLLFPFIFRHCRFSLGSSLAPPSGGPGSLPLASATAHPSSSSPSPPSSSPPSLRCPSSSRSARSTSERRREARTARPHTSLLTRSCGCRSSLRSALCSPPLPTSWSASHPRRRPSSGERCREASLPAVAYFSARSHQHDGPCVVCGVALRPSLLELGLVHSAVASFMVGFPVCVSHSLWSAS